MPAPAANDEWSEPLQVHVWGPRACFTMVGTRAEPFSLPIIPPPAAEGCLAAISWKPEIVFRVNRIEVLKPIQRSTIRLNGMGSKPTSYNRPHTLDLAQRNLTILRDVAYVIDFSIGLRPHHTVRKSIDDYVEQFRRRIVGRRCFRDPCLGMRKFTAGFGPVDDTTPRPINLMDSLGMIPHSRIYACRSPSGDIRDAPVLRDYYFDAKIDRGVMVVPEHGIVPEHGGV